MKFLQNVEKWRAPAATLGLFDTTQEEVEEMRRDDLEIAAGGSVVGQLRESVGWHSEEGQAKLDGWEDDAHRRLEQAKNLPPERWCEVWGVDD
jgi:hypothetical protein